MSIDQKEKPRTQGQTRPDAKEHKKKARWKGILKWAVLGTAGLIVVSTLANYVWVNSGDNEWKLAGEKNGVKAYYMKVPGHGLIKTKGVVRLQTTMDAVVEVFYAVDDCAELMPDCLFAKYLERHDEKQMFYIHSAITLPPLKPRELVLATQFIVYPETKTVVHEVRAAPNKIPNDDKYIRLAHLNNTWRFTDVGNGEIEIELIADMDIAGHFPDFLFNLEEPNSMYPFLGVDIPNMLKRDRYRNAYHSFLDPIRPAASIGSIDGAEATETAELTGLAEPTQPAESMETTLTAN